MGINTYGVMLPYHASLPLRVTPPPYIPHLGAPKALGNMTWHLTITRVTFSKTDAQIIKMSPQWITALLVLF